MQPDTAKKARKVELVLLVIVVIWGINTPVMKIGLDAMAPLVYNTFRLVIAAIIAAAVLVTTKRYRPMPAKDLRQVIALSVTGFFLNQLFIIYGMDATTAGNAALVLATLPVEVALINRVLGFEPLSGRIALGIALSLAGVILTVVGAGREISLSGQHIVGAALIIVGQFGYGYYTVRFKQLVDHYSLYQIITYVFTISAVLFFLIAIPDLTRTNWSSVPPAAWYSIAFSAVFALALANFTWIWAVRLLGTTRVSLYPNLCPIISIAFACLYLDETFGLLQAAGGAVIFLGLYLARGSSLPSSAATGVQKG